MFGFGSFMTNCSSVVMLEFCENTFVLFWATTVVLASCLQET